MSPRAISAVYAGGMDADDEYAAACARIDAWRGERMDGVRRVAGSRWTLRGRPDEHRMMATEAHGFVAQGTGPTREAATIALARLLPLPAPAALPTRETLEEIGVGDLGTEASCGVAARPMRRAS